MNKDMIKFCPRCLSSNTSFDSNGTTVWDCCKNCGFGVRNSKAPNSQYRFAEFPIISRDELNKMHEEVKKEKASK